MTNVTSLSIFRTHAQKEDIKLFDSKNTSIHSLIIQHVYTLKNSTAFMVETAPGLRWSGGGGGGGGGGIENASFHSFVNGELL